MSSDPRADDPFRPAAEPASPPADETTWPSATGADPARAPGPAVPRPGSRRASVLVNALLGLAAVVAVGGVAFAVGRATAPAAAANGNGGRFGNGGPVFEGPNASGAPGNGGFVGQGGPGGGGGLSIEGKVTAISADSITLELANGQTVTIPTTTQTTYHTRSAATAADVTTGSTVQVQLQGGRGLLNGNGNGNNGNGNGNGGPNASGQPRTLPAAGSVTVLPAGS